ncbi:unnamed protein product [Phytophthora fragariaefolia]|uniref:Unnamed protein product n=1 Tax=Phytophthora fragariaefolia TaxID=1490495 RepID=A0A9W6UAT2_9STRA|nr:unnamed protein product [Phytophthora fragariaefolia]
MAKKLSVVAASVDCKSTVMLEKSVMKAMGVSHGDVLLLAQGGRNTVAVAHLDESDEAQTGAARLNTTMRRNLRVDINDDVVVTSLGSDVPNGKSIRVLPIDDTVDEDMLEEQLFEKYLQPHFAGAFRPVHQGDLFLARSLVRGEPDVEFVVIETNPTPYCIVGPDTDIFYNGTPVSRHDVL